MSEPEISSDISCHLETNTFAEVVPYYFNSTDSTVSMETEESHDSHVIIDSPLPVNFPNYRVSFEFLEEQNIEENVNEEVQNEVAPVVMSAGITLDSNDSTAEELDTVPCESTTDAGQDNSLINGEGCVTYTHLQEDDVMVTSSRLGPHSYVNWSVVVNFNKENEETLKKRKNIIRSKGSRIAVRQRPPQPLPRPSYKASRALALVSRKRRVSGKTRPLQGTTTSEGDMAQADEMGDEGEGHSDDGFVEGSEGNGGRRRIKKRQGGLHGFLPSLLTTVSPSSSPSNTPIRRRSASRKARIKPRARRSFKPTPASADISTQETTTPGPASSETDEKEVDIPEEIEVAVSSDNNLPLQQNKLVEEEEEEEEEMSRQTSVGRKQFTPTSGGTSSLANGSTNEMIKKTTSVSKKPVGAGTRSRDRIQESNNESQTSDTELTSTSALSLSGGSGFIQKGLKLDSDLSTAPLSSETSDISGNEEGGAKKTGQTGIPKPTKNSPVLQRKLVKDVSQPVSLRNNGSRSAGTTSSKVAGSFVSKRTSVAAMISQFDSSASSSPENALKKHTTPTKDSPSSPKHDRSKSYHSPVKPTLSAKPGIPPKPQISSPKQTTPPRIMPSDTTDSVLSEEKPEDLKPKPTNTRLSPSGPPIKSKSPSPKPSSQNSEVSETNKGPESKNEVSRVTKERISQPKVVKRHVTTPTNSRMSPDRPTKLPAVKKTTSPSSVRTPSIKTTPTKPLLTNKVSVKKPPSKTTPIVEKTTSNPLEVSTEKDSTTAKSNQNITTPPRSTKAVIVKAKKTGSSGESESDSDNRSVATPTTVKSSTSSKRSITRSSITTPNCDKSSPLAESTKRTPATPTTTKNLTPATPTTTKSSTPSATPTVTKSLTSAATPTSTKSSTSAATPTSTKSSTPAATPTSTKSSTSAATLTSTKSSTSAATPTSTKSLTPAATPTSTKSSTSAATLTSTKSSTSAATPTSTKSSTSAATPTSTKSSTPAATPISTKSSTPVAMPTATKCSTVTTTSLISATPITVPVTVPAALTSEATPIIDESIVVATVTSTTPTTNSTIDKLATPTVDEPVPQRPARTKKKSLKIKTESESLAAEPRPRGPRRPPPEPPVSPQPTSSPVSTTPPTQQIDSQAKESSKSPRNYEEFVPTLLRSNSMSSQPSSSPPPIPEKETSHYEGITFEAIPQSLSTNNATRRPPPPAPHKTLSRTKSLESPVSDKDDVPPPLPPRNYNLDEAVISLPTSLSTVEERVGPVSPTMNLSRSSGGRNMPLIKTQSVINVPPPLPSQPIPKRKSTLGHQSSPPSCSPLLKRKEIPSTLMKSSPPLATARKKPENLYEEIEIGPLGPAPFQSSNSSPQLLPKFSHTVTQHYEMSEAYLKDRPHPLPSYAKISSSPPGSVDMTDYHQRRFSASVCVTNSLGLSPVSIKRANSDRLQHSRLPVVISPLEERHPLQRTPSMDILDQRMNPTVHNSLTDPGYSSGEDDEHNVVSPNNKLPEPPRSKFNLSHKEGHPNKLGLDEEPLYQYINHTEFLSTPLMSHIERCDSASSTSSQLEIARQLSYNHRKLWSEQPEVIESGVLSMLSEQDRKLQEAMFEVITSEASYLRSVNVLIEHFMDDPGMNPNLPEGRRILDKRQHHVLFSNVKEVQETSGRFLKELQQRQRESAIIQNICDIILKYAEGEFTCYISYCTNQVYQMRELTELLETNIMFQDYIKRLESHHRCQNLSLTSFLLLPMQRITRMPLLILAILNRTPMNHPNHPLVEKTLRTVQKLVTSCNDGARRMERTEELHLIHRQLDFGKMKPFPLVSVSRQLERKGSLTLLQVDQRLFGRPRIRRIPVYVFAFTDYVLITKKKDNSKGQVSYHVIDYGSKAVIEVVEQLKVLSNVTFPKHVFGEQETIAKATWAVSMAEEPNAFLMIFLENSSQKSEKYILVPQNDTDRARWLEALSHPAKEKQKDDEKIYESWDCPQVQAVYDYHPEQPDELSLMRGDVVKVYRKMADGWYEGEKLRDLQWGWFPSNFTVEIENAHTRARNLHERHRLLSLPFNPDDFLHQFNVSS